ncbi:MAG: M20/M25/M40 family metallo-hydrolase [Myxococcaceae bacterium]
MTRLLPLLAVSAAFTGWAETPAEKAAQKLITADTIRAHVRFLASDALEGRGPATRGDQLAQQYIAAQLEGLGLKPAGANGSWLQKLDVVGTDGHPDQVTFIGPGGKALTLKNSDDYILVAGQQEPTSKLDKAELVFAGYGIQAPEYKWDDFKGIDLKNKVLLVMNNDPEDDPNLFAGKARLWYGRWDYKYEKAARMGAAGAIIIHTTPSAGYPWQVVQTSWAGEQFDLPSTEPSSLEVKGWTTEEASRKIVALAGKDLDQLRKAAQSRDFKPVPLGVTLSTVFNSQVQKKTTANVLAVLPGSDPELSKQYVVFSAHHDHLGKKPGAKPGEDDIYNGAVDNASGVAALLTVARALTSLPKAPRRSVLFAVVAAEEQGLLGSQYLVEHPPVPVGMMAADINIDGVNIWGRTKDVSVIGLGKSSLDATIGKLAAGQKRTVKPDELADRGFFYRSDQFNFAKWGVPSAYFSSGNDYLGRPEGWGKQMREQWEEKHYHQPSDELTDAWDLAGAVDDLQLYFQLCIEVANSTRLPQWNAGDEFEAARKKALQAVGMQ